MATEEFISQSPRLEARHLIFKDIVFRHSGLVKRDAWRTFCTNTGQHSGDRSKCGTCRNKTCRPTPGVPVLDPNSSPRRTLPDSYALTRRRIARQSVVALVPASTTTTPPRFVLECVPETNADTPPRIPPWRASKICSSVWCERNLFGKTAKQESFRSCTRICPVRKECWGRSAESRREKCMIKQNAKHDMRVRMMVFETTQNAATWATREKNLRVWNVRDGVCVYFLQLPSLAKEWSYPVTETHCKDENS